MSEGFGATAVVDPTTEELGRGYDVVIDCVGKPGLLDRCVDAVATKGRIVVAGVCAEPDPYLPMLALLKEVTIGFAVYYRPEEFETVIAAFADGRIDPSGLVTDTVGLDQLDSAFDRLVGNPTDAKILVDPRVALGRPDLRPMSVLQRDPSATARRLEEWLTDVAGLEEVQVDDITIPGATGWSNETILFDARWRRRRSELGATSWWPASRPTEYSVFPDDTFVAQYEIMRALGERHRRADRSRALVRAVDRVVRPARSGS